MTIFSGRSPKEREDSREKLTSRLFTKATVRGVAVMLEVFTNNRNRTVADIRHIFRVTAETWVSRCVA